jgi:hypothetical protein
MSSVRHFVPLALSLSLAACYGAAPPRPPRVPLPPIDPSAELLVHSESRTTMESVEKTATSCPQGKGEGDPSCTVTRYNETEPVTRTTTTASIGDQALTYAQFKVITDPKWDEKLGELDDLSHKCQRANVPRYAGLGLLAVGLLVGPIISSQADATTGSVVMWGGLLGGGASYALGYFAFGGRDCVEARALYTYLDTSQEQGWTSVEGADYATDMKALAEQFNAIHGARPASADNRRAGAMRMRR